TLFPHQTRNPISPMSSPLLFQGLLDARTAIALFTLLVVDGADLHTQTLVLPLPRTRLGLSPSPIIIATGRDLKTVAEMANGMFGFHRVNPAVPLLGGSERMPKVFFKISRC